MDPVDVQLRDGRRVRLRAICEQDGEKLQDAIRALSVQSSYYRFFSPLPKLPTKLLERATRPEPERELQLVAVIGEGADEKIIAGARYAAIPDSRDCEFAVAVVDAWHGLGLARSLLEVLMAEARLRGFERMEGSVLSTNRRMLTFVQRLGFTEMASPEGPTVRMVRRDLRLAP